MTLEETSDNFEFNLLGIISVAATFVINLLNGTLLNVFPKINLPEMNVNDTVTIILSILSVIFIIVKIANGILTFIHKRRSMREEKYFQDKFKNHHSKKK